MTTKLETKLEMQWKRCKEWKQIFVYSSYCKRYNNEHCPMKCNYAKEQAR